jgi:TIR domain
MITEMHKIDEITRPLGLDPVLDSSIALLDQQPSPPLRVFISYKEKDRAATLDIKKALLRIGGGNIRVFVSGDEPAGIQWREGVLNELRQAHILIFLYTDPEARWDWCLYETGYFDARQHPDELDRRLYVLHGCEVPPSGPFLGLNTVAVDTSAKPDDTGLKRFLEILFERSTNPAVNPYWDEGGCVDLVTALAAPFRGRKALAPPDEYVRRLTFRLTKEAATEAALREGRIPADAMVTGTKKTFELFGLRAAKTWQDLEKSWYRKISLPADGNTCQDPVALWVESVAEKMLEAINGEDFDDGLPLFFSQFAKTRAQALFRPSLARLAAYSDCYEFDIVFVDVPPELAAMSEGPLTTVGGLLRLAHMFRFGWVEATAKEVINRPPAELADVARNAGRRLRSITAESFNQGIRTEQAVLLAFEEGSALQTEIKQAIKEWHETVYPEIDKSFGDKHTARILDALKKASAINWQFHRACAKRYCEIIEKHWGEGCGPLDPV